MNVIQVLGINKFEIVVGLLDSFVELGEDFCFCNCTFR